MGWISPSSSASGAKDPPPKKHVDWSSSINSPDWEQYTEPQVIVPTIILSATIIGSWAFYRSYLRRIPGAAYIKPGWFRRRTLFGKVVRVGDGDNFHMFHTPGGRMAGWGWLRTVPEWEAKKKDKRTIPIRIAGIDAPENAHFGKEAQPLAAEALQWLNNYLMDRRIRAKIYRIDQYKRIVATVYVRKFGFKKDVGLEMLKNGLATVYEARTGAEFGLLEQQYREAEAKAKKAKKGIWGLKSSGFESPREYKLRTAAEEEAKAKAKDKDKDDDFSEDIGASWWSMLRKVMFPKRP